MASRNLERLTLVAQVRDGLTAGGQLTEVGETVARVIEHDGRERARIRFDRHQPGMTELVTAGLSTRDYQEYRVDHEHRVAQRHAVYSVTPAVRVALALEQLVVSSPADRKATATWLCPRGLRLDLIGGRDDAGACVASCRKSNR